MGCTLTDDWALLSMLKGGVMTNTAGRCWHCGQDLEGHEFGRETLCLGCGKPTRVCRNCRWYAPSRAQQCSEPMAEAVTNKERANFCGFFEETTEGVAGDAQSVDELREAAELLVGK